MKYRRLSICISVGGEPHRLDGEIQALVTHLRRLLHQRKADRCRQAGLGRPMSAAAKAKLSALRKGKPQPASVVADISRRQTGRKLSPEVRMNISLGKRMYHARQRGEVVDADS